MADRMPGTAMAERVAVIGFLNKQNGKTRDIDLKPGQAIRIGRTVIRLRACERTAPWETHQETGAFVQLLVNERLAGERQDRWRRVFSGWVFKENPALNVVQHPVYDVWVKDCKMRFPGDEADPDDAGKPAADSAGAAPSTGASTESRASQSPTADASPTAPAPAAVADEEQDDPAEEE